ncbi:hypothetical protein DVH24_026971 [Malus domestica]|uniref:Pectinesterase inhibitor domain-containing protein n=1 Tax=Malus domestica TaxID=3750 RepID=A0A498IQ31_MALDO|nr:hypothetical protein DVH24_026971 [Malus domestica]
MILPLLYKSINISHSNCLSSCLSSNQPLQQTGSLLPNGCQSDRTNMQPNTISRSLRLYSSIRPSKRRSRCQRFRHHMVDALKPKALDVLDKALVLVVKEPGNQPAKACANTYQEVLGTDIPQANEDFPKGESKIAALAMINVVQKSDSCESGFPGGSPFKYKSKVVHDFAYVASAIAKLINS